MVERASKTEVLGVGITGLVGSRIAELLSDTYDFTNLSLETGVNIIDPATLEVISKKNGRSVVLHLAAKADVDGCEKDKELGEQGSAWKLNVLGTRNVVEACKKSGKPIFYVSTDFVFDGTKEKYTEEDVPNPQNWYAHTKYEGERIVAESGLPFVIMRLAYPYRAYFAQKKDFVRGIVARLESGETVKAITDHVMTPTFIDDIAQAFDALVKSNAQGIFHVVGSDCLSPYDASVKIARTFGYNEALVQKTTRAEFFNGRAQRPENLYLSNDKIRSHGVKMRSFDEGLSEIRRQLI